jgi:ABC-type spermidine/putrescine transport system permease subunit II
MLVPPLLVAIALAFAGTSDPSQPRHLLPGLATWKLVLLPYVSFSWGQAAFPSSGDHIGKLGGLGLTALVAATVAAILLHGGQAELANLTRDACLLLAVPAIASGVSLLALDTLARFPR